MHIFKKMQNAKKELLKNIEIYKSDEKFVQLENAKLEALEIIIEYTKSCSWLKRSNSVNRMKALFEFNFNTSKVADYLGVNQGSIKASLTYLSNTLAEAIGTNTIDLIMEGHVDVAMLQFRTSTGCMNLEDTIPKQILDIIPTGDSHGQLINECKTELVFLKALSYVGLNRKISTLDKDKLALILDIMLKGDTNYAKERLLIYKYLNDEIKDTDSLFNMIRHVDNLFS